MHATRTAPLLIVAAAAPAIAGILYAEPFPSDPQSPARCAGPRSQAVLISEVLGNTSGADWEFIEICNTGDLPVTITGWSIELWDSDAGSSYGGADAGSPYTVSLDATLAPGETYVFGNSLAIAGYPQPPYRFDLTFQDNAVENSSYTALLTDAGGAVLDAVFVTDGGDGDSPNRAGAPITPAITVGPDGANLPAGFARTDTLGHFVLLNFDTAMLADGSVSGGTPGICQIPAPASAAPLAALLALRTRRR